MAETVNPNQINENFSVPPQPAVPNTASPSPVPSNTEADLNSSIPTNQVITPPPQKANQGSSALKIVLIVIGSLIVLILIGLLAFSFLFKKYFANKLSETLKEEFANQLDMAETVTEPDYLIDEELDIEALNQRLDELNAGFNLPDQDLGVQPDTTAEQQSLVPTQESKRVGDATHGYLSIPSNWGNFFDPGASANHLGYSQMMNWILIMNEGKIYPNNLKAADLARNLHDNQAQTQTVTNLSMTRIQVGTEEIYEVLSYTPADETWLAFWVAEDDLGRSYIISLEGPDIDSPNFDIIKTFSFAG